MNKITKVSAVIVVDKKLLLVSGHERPFFWTPGGHIEKGESLEDALKRELAEELGTTEIRKIIPYITYTSDNEEDRTIREVHNYLVDLSGEVRPKGEIDKIWWVSKEDYFANSAKIQIGVREGLVPKLIADQLL